MATTYATNKPSGYYATYEPTEALKRRQQAVEEVPEPEDSFEVIKKDIRKAAMSSVPIGLQAISGIDKIETAKVMESGLLTENFADSTGKPVKLFEPAGTAQVGNNPDYIVDNINRSTRGWTSRIKLTEEAQNLPPEKINELLKSKNYTQEEIGELMSQTKKISEAAEFSQGISIGAKNPLKFSLHKASEGAIEKGAGTAAQKLGFAVGKAQTLYTVASGAHQTYKGFEEGEVDEVVKGGIKTITPLLLASGNPALMGIASINMVWDLIT